MALVRQSAQVVAHHELLVYRCGVTETPQDAELATALRAAQDTYLASQQAQDERRTLVHTAFTVRHWSVRRIAREMGVQPGTVKAIITAATRSAG